MDADSNKEKNEVWVEINNLNHIGKSANDIEQTLSAMGYDKALLKEILTVSFMERLMEKEESFVDMQQSADNRAAEQAEKEKQEVLQQEGREQQLQTEKMEEERVLEQESEEQEVQKQKVEEELLRQHKEHIRYAKDEKKALNQFLESEGNRE